MKKIILFCSLFWLTHYLHAQEMKLKKIAAFGGMNFSTFLFNEPQKALENQLNYKVGSSLGLNFELELNKHLLRPELLYRTVGSYANIDNNNMTWTLNYFDINIGYMYKVLDGKLFDIAPGIAFGLGYLADGQQFIGQTRFDMVNDNFFKRFDLTGNFMLNFSFHITKNLSLFGEYRFGMSILNIENDASQSTRNIFHTLGFGIALNLSNDK